MLYAGIDEAGYGPMLGPLCAGVSVFEIDDTEDLPCLWRSLRSVVARSRRDTRRGRIAIDDSKNLKGAGASKHPLTHLERGVLLFASVADRQSDWIDDLNDDVFFNAMGIEPPNRKWYDSSTMLPLGSDTGLFRIDRSRLARAMESAAVRCCHVAAAAVPAREFNARVAASGSKAIVNWELMISLAETCWRRASGRRLRLAVDRHGGRTRYLDDLRAAWPQATRQVLQETDTESRYVLTLEGRGPLDISFSAGADADHLPVALASMTAKYVRELMMIRLNRFFASHMPELKPTAGYVEDGRRFLAEVQPVIQTADLLESDLIRSC
ncbi:MAG: hypothetical protein QF733_00695 [Phycisphaerales bacterium]|jgi:hypothetical protein|nr:hypothetical protein [Phycisphaerales bacterium]